MREQEPMTKTMKASDVRADWSQLLNQVFRKETRVLVEKSGVPVAALVSAQDLDRLQQLDKERAQAFSVLSRIGEKFKDESPEEIERQVAQAISEVRAETRQEQAAARQS